MMGLISVILTLIGIDLCLFGGIKIGVCGNVDLFVVWLMGKWKVGIENFDSCPGWMGKFEGKIANQWKQPKIIAIFMDMQVGLCLACGTTLTAHESAIILSYFLFLQFFRNWNYSNINCMIKCFISFVFGWSEWPNKGPVPFLEVT